MSQDSSSWDQDETHVSKSQYLWPFAFQWSFDDLLPSFTPIEGLEVHKDCWDQRIQFFHVTCASGPVRRGQCTIPQWWNLDTAPGRFATRSSVTYHGWSFALRCLQTQWQGFPTALGCWLVLQACVVATDSMHYRMQLCAPVIRDWKRLNQVMKLLLKEWATWIQKQDVCGCCEC